MNPAKRHEIFSRLRAANPHPTTELEYASPFELLVAVVLSAQSTDKGVNLATRKLFPKASTPEAIYALGEAGLADAIKTIGLYKSKARHLIATCRMLIEQHHSNVPAERAALEALPGVGRKTANVILNTAFGQPTMAVDTHIFRVSNRIGLAPGKTVLEVEKKLLKTIPNEFRIDAHHWLILHGRYVCQARKPKCGECIIADLCEFKHKTLPAPASGKASPRVLRSAKPIQT
jgi:endonuclease-3